MQNKAIFANLGDNIQLLKSITVLLYDFSFKTANFATFTFVVKGMFSLLRHLRTFSQVLATFIKILQFSIFKCILII